MLIPFLLLVVGLVVMVVGAEFLVKGASALAARLGIPAIIIGLTVVAFGTSAPEMAVSAIASLDGSADVAVGNVVGSNIFNVLFILGVSALIAPLTVAPQLVRIDVPLMLAVSLLAWALASDGTITFNEALLLFAGIGAYVVLQIALAKRGPARTDEPEPTEQIRRSHVLLELAQVAGGLVALVIGSRWLVSAAVDIAGLLGVSDTVVGLTIVAAGTSMPEVATSVMATIRGERDIAVGNVVGSNIFNLLAVLGIAGVLSPDGLSIAPSMLALDFVLMVAIAAVCVPIFVTGRQISRAEGAVFVLGYVAYTAWLVVQASDPAHAPGLLKLITYGVLPVGLLLLGGSWFSELRAPRTPQPVAG